jgi:membrane-bound serine protease (ClpP class)
MRFLFLVLLQSFMLIVHGVEVTEIPLHGYLGSEKISQAQKLLSNAPEGGVVLIEVDSQSGDIEQVLNFARSLYLYKHDHRGKVIVYIDGKALGPAALVPFVSDELFVSVIVSWGDILYGNEGQLPGNILRSQVISLIDAKHASSRDFVFLAAAMSDKELPAEIKLESSAQSTYQFVPGQPLVVNQQQLKGAWFVQGIEPLQAFRARWNIARAEGSAQSDEDSPQTQVQDKLQQRLKKHIQRPPDKPITIGHILIEDHSVSISQATWLYVKNALDYYKKSKPAFVILELNTPGGEVYAAQKISDALKEFDTQYDIPIVCYINNWAISAGAMLAYSCRFIAVTKDASMGAAEPILMGEDNQMKTASEKVNSALRADFANRARFYDRNPWIAEAMVDKDLILVQRHGNIIKLDTESQIKQSGPNPDIVITPKGKLLTLNAQELMQYGVADMLLLPEKTGEITEEERALGHWPASKMLLFANPFFKQFKDVLIDSYQMDWKGRFFAFLASPMVSSLLLMGVILGFYVELSTPGFGIAGSIGVISLILIVLSSFALEIAHWLELILLGIGMLILLAELFVIPSFGILGVFGLLCFLMGLFGLLVPGLSSVEYEFDTQTFNAAGQVALERLLWLCGSLIGAFVIIAVLARYVTPVIAGYSKLVLKGNEQDASQGYIAGESPSKMPKVGEKGEALTTLRPAGRVLINGHIWEALSQGAFIEKASEVEVVGNESNSVIVKASKE